MMRRGESRFIAAKVLHGMRQHPDRGVREILDGVLYDMLEEEIGDAEARQVRADSEAWRCQVLDEKNSSYVAWLASSAFAQLKEIDLLLLRRCCDVLINAGHSSRINLSALRASMRGNTLDSDVSLILRGEREARNWATVLLGDLDNELLEYDDPRLSVMLEAFAGGLMEDVGALSVDLLRVVIADMSRGGYRGIVTRHQSRIWAVQLLYQMDITSFEAKDLLFDNFWMLMLREELGCGVAEIIFRWIPDWQNAIAALSFRDFTKALIEGVIANREKIDGLISKSAEHWDLGRIGSIERSVLRLAVFEMTCHGDVPAVVCIDEAVEIIKDFSPEASSGFVNGVLDRILRDMKEGVT